MMSRLTWQKQEAYHRRHPLTMLLPYSLPKDFDHGWLEER